MNLDGALRLATYVCQMFSCSWWNSGASNKIGKDEVHDLGLTRMKYMLTITNSEKDSHIAYVTVNIALDQS